MTNRTQYVLEITKPDRLFIAEILRGESIVASGCGAEVNDAIESAAQDMAAYLKQQERKENPDRADER